MFPFFLQCVNYALILKSKQVSIAAREHLLNPTSTCPNYLFFDKRTMPESKEIDDEVISLLRDLNTVLVLCFGEVRSVQKYSSLAVDFFLKKEGQQMLLCLTRICKD